MTWDVLDTDMSRPSQVYFSMWMRSMWVHADWGRSGRLIWDPRRFLGLHSCMIADVLLNNQHLFSSACQGRQKK